MFRLPDRVRWHDGRRFTVADVKCTWDRVAGVSEDEPRINPREGWFTNMAGTDVESNHVVLFRLKRPRPVIPGLSCVGIFAGLTLPRVGGADARASYRNDNVSFR